MDLIAGNYSASSSEEDDVEDKTAEEDSELDDVTRDSDIDHTQLIPLPEFDLDASGMGTTNKQIDPKVSVFRNEYVAEREAKQSVLEQHVQLSNTVLSSVETKGQKLCWQFRKHGRCRQGHKCRFAHDSDLFNGAGTRPKSDIIPEGSEYSAPRGYEHPLEEEEEVMKKKKRKFGLPETLIPNAKVITIYKDNKTKERSLDDESSS